MLCIVVDLEGVQIKSGGDCGRDDFCTFSSNKRCLAFFTCSNRSETIKMVSTSKIRLGLNFYDF